MAGAIDQSRNFQKKTPASTDRRKAVARWRILELLRERLVSETLGGDGASSQLERLASEVATKKRDPYSAVDELMKNVSSQ